SSFITAATVGSSNDSCAITWHQWHAEYPTDSSTALSSARARSNASSDHGYQSTGLSWCCRRYGLVSSASRFMGAFLPPPLVLCGLLTPMPSEIRKEGLGLERRRTQGGTRPRRSRSPERPSRVSPESPGARRRAGVGDASCATWPRWPRDRS